jgi:hypothetical protein
VVISTQDSKESTSTTLEEENTYTTNFGEKNYEPPPTSK